MIPSRHSRALPRGRAGKTGGSSLAWPDLVWPGSFYDQNKKLVRSQNHIIREESLKDDTVTLSKCIVCIVIGC